jgi:hypothetical protein
MSKLNYPIILLFLHICLKSNAQRNEVLNYQDSLIEFTACLEIPIAEFIDNSIDFNALFRKIYKLPDSYELKRYEMSYIRYRKDPVIFMGRFLDGKVTSSVDHALSYSVEEKNSTGMSFYNIKIGPKASNEVKLTNTCLIIDNHKLKPVKAKWIDITELNEFKENDEWKNYDVVSMHLFAETENGECIVKSTRYGACFNRWILPCTFKNLTFQLEVIGKDGITPIETLYLFVNHL